jgi:hypothetical protein
MNVQITDNINYLSVALDGNVLLLNKAHIRSIEVVKRDTLKIDTCQQSLNQLYIKFGDVTVPELLGDVHELREAVSAMVNSNSDAGTSSLLTAISDIDKKLATINSNVLDSTTTLNRSLGSIIDHLSDIKILLDGAYNAYKEPLRIDEVTPDLIYKGYVSIVSGSPTDPVWAIQRIKKSGTNTTIAWANGNKNFTNVWQDHALLTYIPL